MDDGLVGAAEGKEPHGDNVHPLDEVGNACKGPGEEERHQADEHRGGNGVGIVEHVDAARLHGHVADEAAAQAAEHGEPDEADGVEPALAGHERAGQAADGDGCEVKPRGKRHGDVGAEVFKEVWHGFLHKRRGG